MPFYSSEMYQNRLRYLDQQLFLFNYVKDNLTKIIPVNVELSSKNIMVSEKTENKSQGRISPEINFEFIGIERSLANASASSKNHSRRSGW